MSPLRGFGASADRLVKFSFGSCRDGVVGCVVYEEWS